MSTLRNASAARRLMALAFLVAALGIPVQIAGGAPYPVVPPGLLILLAAAALVAFVPWRWTPSAALLVTAFMLAGFFGTYLTMTLGRLAGSTGAVQAAGTWLQMVAILVTAIAGIAETVRLVRSRASRRAVQA